MIEKETEPMECEVEADAAGTGNQVSSKSFIANHPEATVSTRPATKCIDLSKPVGSRDCAHLKAVSRSNKNPYASLRNRKNDVPSSCWRKLSHQPWTSILMFWFTFQFAITRAICRCASVVVASFAALWPTIMLTNICKQAMGHVTLSWSMLWHSPFIVMSARVWSCFKTINVSFVAFSKSYATTVLSKFLCTLYYNFIAFFPTARMTRLLLMTSGSQLLKHRSIKRLKLKRNGLKSISLSKFNLLSRCWLFTNFSTFQKNIWIWSEKSFKYWQGNLAQMQSQGERNRKPGLDVLHQCNLASTSMCLPFDPAFSWHAVTERSDKSIRTDVSLVITFLIFNCLFSSIVNWQKIFDRLW